MSEIDPPRLCANEVSAASNLDDGPVIELWYGESMRFGGRGWSNRWLTVPGRITCRAGLHDARWSIRGTLQGGPFPLGPTAYRLAGRGDFNLEIDPGGLEDGVYCLRIDAVDRRQRTASRSVTLHLSFDSSPTLPWVCDWADMPRIDAAAQVVDGRWSIDRGSLRVEGIGYDRMVTLGSRAWTDVDVLVPVTVHGYSRDPLAYIPPSCGALVGLVLRWDGHTNWHDLIPYRGYKPFGMMAVHLHRFAGQSRFALYDNDDQLRPAEAPPRELDLGRRYWFRAGVVSRPSGPSRYRFKAWAEGQPEPPWMCEADGTPAERGAGSIALVAHHTDASFGRVMVRAMGRADGGQAPSPFPFQEPPAS